MQIDHCSNTQDSCPHVVKDPAPMDTRWPAGEGSWKAPGLKGRTVGGDQPCMGRAVRGDQAGRGRKLGANGLAGEQLDINQAGMGVVRG